MKPRKRKIKLAAWGGVLISAATIVGLVMPEKSDFLMKMALALSGLFAAIGIAIGIDDKAEAAKFIATMTAVRKDPK